MRLRLRRWMRSDRTWWTLLALTLVGVSAAYYLAHEAEKRETEWVHGLQPKSPGPTEPFLPSAAASPADTTPSRPAPAVVEIVTTPVAVTVAAMTDACRDIMQRRGPWKDAEAAVPWPACVDTSGRPMVVQFCTYARLATGEWVHTGNTADVPRCRAELPLLRQGKGRGAASR
ncbi:MAG TPA: hypothetical protein VFU46_04465 [Gemmatimonadales bacterium]|nr:hypothetical protein [Gemmatimonadales bacterium]